MSKMRIITMRKFGYCSGIGESNTFVYRALAVNKKYNYVNLKRSSIPQINSLVLYILLFLYIPTMST